MAMKVSVRKIGYAVALVGVSVPFAMPGLGHDKSAVALMKQVATDPFSLLAARSPGKRNGARLVSTKRLRGSAVAAVPKEFGLPHAAIPAFFSPPAQNLADGFLPVFSSPADEIAPAFGNSPILPPQDGPGPGLHGGGWSVPIIPIGIGGSANPFPSIGGGDTVPVPSIPEPSSWSMLVIGFLMVGASIRARAV